jgi:hypothetical protein
MNLVRQVEYGDQKMEIRIHYVMDVIIAKDISL